MKLLKCFSFIMLCAVLPVLLSGDAAQAQSILSVGSGETYTTISAAITAASPGDIISIQPGTYTAFTVGKQNLVIQAASSGVIVSGGGTIGATVTTTGVIIAGLAFQGYDTSIKVTDATQFDVFSSILANTNGLQVDASGSTVNAFGNQWAGGIDPWTTGIITGSYTSGVYVEPWYDANFDPSNPWGDVTFDGTLSAYDASGALKHEVMNPTLGQDAINIGDVDYDGTLTAADASLMLSRVVDLIPSFSAVELLKTSRAPFYDNASFKFNVDLDDENIIVSVGLADAEKVRSGYLEIEYNKDVLSFRSFSAHDEAGKAGMMVAGHGVDGVARIATASARMIDEEDVMLGRFVFSRLNKDAAVEFKSTFFRLNGYEGVHNLTIAPAIPVQYKLMANYPNPFNPDTYIPFQIPERADISIDIYNVLGQLVKTIRVEDKPAGTYRIKWEGINNTGLKVSSGVYLYRMRANGKVIATKKMTLIK